MITRDQATNLLKDFEEVLSFIDDPFGKAMVSKTHNSNWYNIWEEVIKALKAIAAGQPTFDHGLSSDPFDNNFSLDCSTYDPKVFLWRMLVANYYFFQKVYGELECDKTFNKEIETKMRYASTKLQKKIHIITHDDKGFPYYNTSDSIALIQLVNKFHQKVNCLLFHKGSPSYSRLLPEIFRPEGPHGNLLTLHPLTVGSVVNAEISKSLRK